MPSHGILQLAVVSGLLACASLRLPVVGAESRCAAGEQLWSTGGQSSMNQCGSWPTHCSCAGAAQKVVPIFRASSMPGARAARGGAVAAFPCRHATGPHGCAAALVTDAGALSRQFFDPVPAGDVLVSALLRVRYADTSGHATLRAKLNGAQPVPLLLRGGLHVPFCRMTDAPLRPDAFVPGAANALGFSFVAGGGGDDASEGHGGSASAAWIHSVELELCHKRTPCRLVYPPRTNLCCGPRSSPWVPLDGMVALVALQRARVAGCPRDAVAVPLAHCAGRRRTMQ